jgi:hypothetical protein
MKSFEKELKTFFKLNNIPFKDYSKSFKNLDFSFVDPGTQYRFHFDAKEKRQVYNMNNWQIENVPQEHLFIIDDLAARKVLGYAPKSGIIIRDNLRKKYFLFTILDLFLMPKKRANRSIRKNIETFKGKWLLDFRNVKMSDSLDEIFNEIKKYLKNGEKIFFETLKCYGEYYTEIIDEQGITRIPEHWEIDVSTTR